MNYLFLNTNFALKLQRKCWKGDVVTFTTHLSVTIKRLTRYKKSSFGRHVGLFGFPGWKSSDPKSIGIKTFLSFFFLEDASKFIPSIWWHIFFIFCTQDIYYFNYKERIKKKLITNILNNRNNRHTYNYLHIQLYTLQPKNSRAIAEWGSFNKELINT